MEGVASDKNIAFTLQEDEADGLYYHHEEDEAATFSAALRVAQTSTLVGVGTLQTTLSVTGAATLLARFCCHAGRGAVFTLAVTGAAGLSSTLSATASSSTLAVTQAATFSATLQVAQATGLTSAAALSSTVAVTGTAT
jgi:hypothetical protein